MYELIELGAGLRTAIFSAGDMPVGEERVLAIQKAATQRELQSVDARAALYKAEAAIGELLKPVDCPLQHLFAPGLYIRTIYIPANSVLVGKIHKHRHGNILSKGSVIVFTEQG